MASQPPTEPPPLLQITDENRTMILMLLDRIQTVATRSLADSKTTKDTKTAGTLLMNRAAIDEIVADVSQIKTMFQR
jgi:hypothetical protein